MSTSAFSEYRSKITLREISPSLWILLGPLDNQLSNEERCINIDEATKWAHSWLNNYIVSYNLIVDSKAFNRKNKYEG
jgi:hypothetical protein